MISKSIVLKMSNLEPFVILTITLNPQIFCKGAENINYTLLLQIITIYCNISFNSWVTRRFCGIRSVIYAQNVCRLHTFLYVFKLQIMMRLLSVCFPTSTLFIVSKWEEKRMFSNLKYLLTIWSTV